MQRLSERLFIGNYADLLSESEEASAHIQAILNLAEALPLSHPRSLFLDIKDGHPLPLDKTSSGLEFLLNAHQDGLNILVACGAGVSRSVTFCCLLLNQTQGMSLIDAFRHIKSQYDKALPHPELWKTVCEVYDEPFEYGQILAF